MYENYLCVFSFLFEPVFSILRDYHFLQYRTFGLSIGLYASPKMGSFEHMTIGKLGRTNTLSPFCRQENETSSGCQEIARSRISWHLPWSFCVFVFLLWGPGQVTVLTDGQGQEGWRTGSHP